MSCSLLIPEETRVRIMDYLEALCFGKSSAGKLLGTALKGRDLGALTADSFFDALLDTKKPQIFAESAVVGDGSDWNLTELGILGDVSISVPVTIFDNGHHTAPVRHQVPFPGRLVFTPGALLRNGRGFTPADWEEVTGADGAFCADGYYRLYERRLLPVFQHVNEVATASGKSVLLTIPGLGCGCFAGVFGGKLGAALQEVLVRFLEVYGGSFPSIKAVYFDPYNECGNARFEIHGISLMVRPLLQGNGSKSQLSLPTDYEEDGDDFSECMLFSIVAWDHVSWPGNDFFAGSRCTDDGVKAAATDSMAVITGVKGSYDSSCGVYLPPGKYRTWGEVVKKNGLKLSGAIEE